MLEFFWKYLLPAIVGGTIIVLSIMLILESIENNTVVVLQWMSGRWKKVRRLKNENDLRGEIHDLTQSLRYAEDALARQRALIDKLYRQIDTLTHYIPQKPIGFMEEKEGATVEMYNTWKLVQCLKRIVEQEKNVEIASKNLDFFMWRGILTEIFDDAKEALRP